MEESRHLRLPCAGRAFLVGCGRSGTTLLQSLIASHSQIASFPETEMFMAICGPLPQRTSGIEPAGIRDRLRALVGEGRLRAGVAARNSRGDVRHRLAQLGHEDLMDRFPAAGRDMQAQMQAAIAILDDLAARQAKLRWLEKTPLHLCYIDQITAAAPKARFIHMVRDGADVVASLYDARCRYPEAWAAFYPTLDSCITQWNHCLALTQRYVGRPNHTVVRYEQITEDPKAALQRICLFLDVAFEEAMLDGYREAAQQIIRPEELWKEGATAAIRSANGGKFHTVFDSVQQQYVRDRLVPVDWRTLAPDL